jgi:hypothetical protein
LIFSFPFQEKVQLSRKKNYELAYNENDIDAVMINREPNLSEKINLVSPIVSPFANKKASIKLKINLIEALLSCRGRDRTSTRWLAIAQSSVVDPGRLYIAT